MGDKMGLVTLKQFMRPNGRVAWPQAEVKDELAEFHEKEGILLSCEILSTGKVAIYGRYPDWPLEREFLELADNGPGDREPPKMVEVVLERLKENGRELDEDKD